MFDYHILMNGTVPILYDSDGNRLPDRVTITERGEILVTKSLRGVKIWNTTPKYIADTETKMKKWIQEKRLRDL